MSVRMGGKSAQRRRNSLCKGPVVEEGQISVEEGLDHAEAAGGIWGQGCETHGQVFGS